MLNNTESKIIIKMKDIDNANRFIKCLKRFCEIASTGGDAELVIRHNNELKNCGFIAHDLIVKSINHDT
jgi:hypothetical protein